MLKAYGDIRLREMADASLGRNRTRLIGTMLSFFFSVFQVVRAKY